MACDVGRAALDRYLDDALPAPEAAALEQHLKGCAVCASAALSRRELQLAIRDAGATFRPRPSFRARIERAARPRSGVRPTTLWLLPIAAALVAGAGVFALRRTGGSGISLAAREAVDLHVTQLASTGPLDVVSTDSHTVKPWFEGRVPFTFPLPDLAGSPFELLGGRVVYLDGVPAAHLLFRVRKHRVSAFVLAKRPGDAALDDVAPGEPTRSFRLRSFTNEGLRWVLVSDTGAEDVDALAARLTGARGEKR